MLQADLSLEPATMPAVLDLADVRRWIDGLRAEQAPGDSFELDRIRATGANAHTLGGGWLVLPRTEPIEVLHVVAHGGTELPEQFADTYAPQDPRLLAQSMLDNADLGTAAMATRLALQPHGRAVAFFGCTRLLVDANRALTEQQVPRTTYRGVPLLRDDLSAERRAEVAATLLQPWLAGIEQCLADHRQTVTRIVHHHSFDEFPGSATPHDRSRARRPAAMLFQDRQNNGGGTFLPQGELQRLVAALRTPLRRLDATAEVEVDSSYVAPMMPIVPHTVPVCVYELRKDLLRDRAARETLFTALLDIL
jgi:predicted N-formylglutamate amidohydrolase